MRTCRWLTGDIVPYCLGRFERRLYNWTSSHDLVLFCNEPGIAYVERPLSSLLIPANSLCG
jgi:hypothetical protein